MLVLGLPTGRLRRYILDSEDLVAIRTQTTGVAGLLSRFLQDYWLEYQQGLDRVAAERIVVSITDLMATAYADVLPSGSDLTSALPVHHSNILKISRRALCCRYSSGRAAGFNTVIQAVVSNTRGLHVYDHF